MASDEGNCPCGSGATTGNCPFCGGEEAPLRLADPRLAVRRRLKRIGAGADGSRPIRHMQEELK